MAEQDQNRNEAATPHKLLEARRKGSVPKSTDANSLATLAVTVAVLAFAGSDITQQELKVFRGIWSNAHQASFEMTDLGLLMASLMYASLAPLAPLFVVLVVAGLLINVLQTGPVFSFFPLKPDFQRLNPVTGLKRLFSMRLIVDTVKSVLKLLILGAVIWFAVAGSLPALMTSLQVGPAGFGSILSSQSIQMLVKLCVALAFIAMFDVVYSRWDFAKRLRMSRREIRDEVKNREGDPRIRSRLRELQREALKRANSLGRVKNADVLITNPTRLAIAVKYDQSQVDAPQVIAKGAGFLAIRMRMEARRHGVPVVENRRLARALFHGVSIERTVPVEHYDVLAKILFWAYAMRERSPEGAR